MSKNDFLSQEEVDALLSGVVGEAETTEGARLPSDFRPYNLATQERIVRGRMPTLEIINERFARLLRLGLFNFMRRSANVTVGPVRAIKFSEFVRNLVAPSNLNLVHVKPLRGTSLFIFDPTLVFLAVDNLFGGDGRSLPKTEGRDFTQTEQRIIQRLLNLVFDSYGKSWQPVYPIEFEYVRAETNTQFANVATPNEVVVAIAASCSVIRAELVLLAGMFSSSGSFVKGRFDRLRRSTGIIRRSLLVNSGAKHFFHAKRILAVGNTVPALHHRHAVHAGSDKLGNIQRNYIAHLHVEYLIEGDLHMRQVDQHRYIRSLYLL